MAWNNGPYFYGISPVNNAILLERQSGKTIGWSLFSSPTSQSSLIQVATHYKFNPSLFPSY